MALRCCLFLAIGMCVAQVALGDEVSERKAPRPVPLATASAVAPRGGELSAIEHLRAAARELEQAGLTAPAAAIRNSAAQLNDEATREIANLAKQIAELQKKSDQLQKLIGKPNAIACRCCFYELSREAAAQFYAEAQPEDWPNRPAFPLPGINVCRNAEQAVQRLRDAGKLVRHAELRIVTPPDRSASATSGGEFPIMIPTSGGGTTFNYQRFGYHCDVEPRLLDSGRILLEVATEIAEGDFKRSITMQGVRVPELTTRRVQAQVGMRLGETVVVCMGANHDRESDEASHGGLAAAIRLISGQVEPSPLTIVTITPVAVESR
jgi:Bacterial type II and III secretion system protein